VTRTEAVAALIAEGFAAKPRDWAMGETIVVWDLAQETVSSGITVFGFVCWLIQEGDGWVLIEIDHQREVRTSPRSFSACIDEIRSRIEATRQLEQ